MEMERWARAVASLVMTCLAFSTSAIAQTEESLPPDQAEGVADSETAPASESSESSESPEIAKARQDYAVAIATRITESWLRPASAKVGMECTVLVRQLPDGTVQSMEFQRCNGDEDVRHSIERAVMYASPLPPAPAPSVFEPVIVMTFRPDM